MTNTCLRKQVELRAGEGPASLHHCIDERKGPVKLLGKAREHDADIGGSFAGQHHQARAGGGRGAQAGWVGEGVQGKRLLQQGDIRGRQGWGERLRLIRLSQVVGRLGGEKGHDCAYLAPDGVGLQGSHCPVHRPAAWAATRVTMGRALH